MTIAPYAIIFIISLCYPTLKKCLGTSFIRSVVFELVYAFARSREWSFPLFMIVLPVCQLPFDSSFSSGRFYFS